jgi:glycosyltransferase involved in cell wall biosynthesis
MRLVKSDFRLVLAGRAGLEGLVRAHGLEDRVKLLGAVSEEEQARWLSNSFAALCLSGDEDPSGRATLEAFHSARPVLAFRDAGAAGELVVHDHNGLILEPTPAALAEGMERLWADRPAARDRGRAARASLRLHRVSWDHVLERLVA